MPVAVNSPPTHYFYPLELQPRDQHHLVAIHLALSPNKILQNMFPPLHFLSSSTFKKKNTTTERRSLPKCRLLSLLCGYQAVRGHSVSQEASTFSSTISLLVLLYSHYHLQAYRCFSIVTSLELSLQYIKKAHFAGKALKYLGLCQTSQVSGCLYGFRAQLLWFCHCHTAVPIEQSCCGCWHFSTAVAQSLLPTQDETGGNDCNEPPQLWPRQYEGELQREVVTFVQDLGDSLLPYISRGIEWQEDT